VTLAFAQRPIALEVTATTKDSTRDATVLADGTALAVGTLTRVVDEPLFVVGEAVLGRSASSLQLSLEVNEVAGIG